jgi:hypothetical protein
MARTASAYVSDIILGTTGDVISRDRQREAIRRYAAENGIEITAWFEDEAYNADVMSRDGIRSLLAGAGLSGSGRPCDCVLVERVWSLSRNWSVLEGFMRELRQKGMKVEAATLLWDCTSQRARHFYSPSRPTKAWAAEPVAATAAVHIHKPKRLYFAHLAHRPARA